MKLNVSQIINNAKTAAVKHSPEILTGIGIAGMITTTILAVKATPKAVLLLNDKKDELEVEKLPVKEVVKTTWKLYIPPIILGGTSIACIISGQNINAKRNAALATAYQLSHNALIEYKEKVIETIGEKKEQKIQDAIAKDRVDSKPIVHESDIFITEKGNTLFYDSISGRYFKSDMDKINKAVNELNRRMINEMYISLNEFYDAIDLPCTRLGNDLGWNISDGLIEPSYSAQIANGVYEGSPCICLSYYLAPRFDFSKLS